MTGTLATLLITYIMTIVIMIMVISTILGITKNTSHPGTHG